MKRNEQVSEIEWTMLSKSTKTGVMAILEEWEREKTEHLEKK